jgi:hypothetical protein
MRAFSLRDVFCLLAVCGSRHKTWQLSFVLRENCRGRMVALLDTPQNLNPYRFFWLWFSKRAV